MKTLEQYNEDRKTEIDEFRKKLAEPKKNGIECPTCKQELSDYRPDESYSQGNYSYAAVRCEQCGFLGSKVK